MPAVVLVHGAWHGAWCFERVVPLLQQAGIDVTAVDLPGHGADQRPLADLHGDAQAVRTVLEGSRGDVILLGHSYGGAVITEAGTHPAVRQLVYLCAFALDEHESCAGAAAAEAEAAGISHEGRPSLGAAFVSGAGGTITLTPDGATQCLYNGCDPATVAWALARLGPQPLETLRQHPTTVAWRTQPSTYVVCADDMGVHPDLQRIMARRCTASVEWPTGHSPFLSRPELVAGLLIDLASS